MTTTVEDDYLKRIYGQEPVPQKVQDAVEKAHNMANRLGNVDLPWQAIVTIAALAESNGHAAEPQKVTVHHTGSGPSLEHLDVEDLRAMVEDVLEVKPKGLHLMGKPKLLQLLAQNEAEYDSKEHDG